MDWKKKETWVYVVNTIAAVALTIIGLVFGGMSPAPAPDPKPEPLPVMVTGQAADEVVRIYESHESDIAPIWEELPEGATMSDAVGVWLGATDLIEIPDTSDDFIDPRQALGTGFFLLLINILMQILPFFRS